MAAQPAALPAFVRVRSGLLGAWRRLPELPQGQTRDRVLLGLRHRGLRAAMSENTRRIEAGVVAALERTGVGHSEAVAAAGACLGALMSTLVDWAGDPRTPIGPRIVQALEHLPHESAARRDDDSCPRRD